MSQTIEHVSSRVLDPEFEQFSYKPVPPLVPLTLLLGVVSALSLLSVIGLVLALGGIVLGTVCLLKLRNSMGGLGGWKLTWTGFALSWLFLLTGTGWHSYLYATEVPEGYERISFGADISRKGFIVESGQVKPHPDLRALDGKKVFLKGYMYPTRQTEGIQSFVLVKDSGDCCFGGQPKITDMVEVVMQDGKTVDDCRLLVSVAGVFRLTNEGGQSELSPVFRIEGHHFEGPARTNY